MGTLIRSLFFSRHHRDNGTVAICLIESHEQIAPYLLSKVSRAYGISYTQLTFTKFLKWEQQ